MKDTFIINDVVKALPAFSATARTENLSQASHILSMPKKTVMSYISQLEQNLGQMLFYRQRGKLLLTEEGEKLYDATSSGLAHIISAMNEIIIPNERSVITIGCPYELLSWLTRRLKSLKQLIPHAEIELIAIDCKYQVNQSEMDIIFTFGLEKHRSVESHLLFEEKAFPVCSPALAKRFDLLNENLTPDKLLNLPLIGGDWSLGISWNNWFTSFGIDFKYHRNVTPQALNYLMSIEMAKNGEGIALAWSEVYQTQLNQGILVALTELSSKSNIGYYMVLNPENPIADVARKWLRIVS